MGAISRVIEKPQDLPRDAYVMPRGQRRHVSELENNAKSLKKWCRLGDSNT